MNNVVSATLQVLPAIILESPGQIFISSPSLKPRLFSTLARREIEATVISHFGSCWWSEYGRAGGLGCKSEKFPASYFYLSVRARVFKLGYSSVLVCGGIMKWHYEQWPKLWGLWSGIKVEYELSYQSTEDGFMDMCDIYCFGI